MAFGSGDRLVYEEYKVAFGSCLEEALGECYCAANVGFGGVKDCGVGFAFDPAFAFHAFFNLGQVVHLVNP